MSLEFRLIESEKRSPFLIAAMDHAIFEECEAGYSPPTLVYHNWEPAVSIANGQTLNDLNHKECKRLGFSIVRMPSGGKAVVHFPDTEFSYSLFIPITGINPRATYEKYCGRISTALASLGIQSAIADNNDIFIGEKKVGGNAQWVKRNYAMQHGLILYEQPSARIMLSLMHPSLYPPQAEQQLQALLTGWRNHSSVSQEELRRTLTENLLEGYSYKKGKLTEREQGRIEELQEQYKNPYDSQAAQIRGLCWLPAPAYKKGVVEVHV